MNPVKWVTNCFSLGTVTFICSRHLRAPLHLWLGFTLLSQNHLMRQWSVVPLVSHSFCSARTTAGNTCKQPQHRRQLGQAHVPVYASFLKPWLSSQTIAFGLHNPSAQFFYTFFTIRKIVRVCWHTYSLVFSPWWLDQQDQCFGLCMNPDSDYLSQAGS